MGPTGEARVARLREVLGDVRKELREASARRLTQLERVCLAALLLAPVVFNAVALLPEITIPVPSVNDDMLHWLFIQRASEALASGQNVFDHWLPQIELGLPQFFYYQHIPHLSVVLLERLSFGALDLLTSFNLVRYVLMVTFPLTVFWSMRRMGFSGVAAAIGGAASSLLVTEPGYGFDYLSYTWRGFGVYTQLWGMHLTFVTLACMVRLQRTGRGLTWAILAFSLLVLSHLIYAYMMAITVLVLFLLCLNRANLVERVVRFGIVGVFAGLIASYMVVPFALETEYLNATPNLQQEKYDSYGIVRILGWLVRGDLLDDTRIPLLTILMGAGLAAAFIGRIRIALLAAILLVVWLVVYAGRPTLGPIADLFPLAQGLLFHRFIGGVHLAAILLIGVGGAAVWQFFAPHRAWWQAIGATLVVFVFLLPAFGERAEFYQLNEQWMRRSVNAIESDADAQAILGRIETLPPGRVYMGLRTDWADLMPFEDLRFYHMLHFEGIEGLAPPSESLSLNSDYIWYFDATDRTDYELFNVRYVVAPALLPVAEFLQPVLETTKYTLYEAPSGGYAMYGSVVARQAFTDQRALFVNNRDWVLGDTLPANRQFVRYDYPSRTVGPLAGTLPCPEGEVSFELFQPGRIDLVAACPNASTLIIKTTYHPNWRVSVDGQPAEAFMVSPSLIGVNLASGRHSVTAEYRPSPLKLPLLLVGLAALLVALIAGPRLDDVAASVAGRVPLPQFRSPLWTGIARRRHRGPLGNEGAIDTPLVEGPTEAGVLKPEPEPEPEPEPDPPTELERELPAEPESGPAPAALARGGIARRPIASRPVVAGEGPDPAPWSEAVLGETAAAALGRLSSAVRGRLRLSSRLPRGTSRRGSISAMSGWAAEAAARGAAIVPPVVRPPVARLTTRGDAPPSALTARERAGAFADPWSALPVIALSGLSLLCYVLVYLAQRAINLDGSESSLDPKSIAQVAGELRLYYLVTAVLFVLYGGVVVIVWRRRSVGGLTRTVLLATPIIVQLGLMIDRPYLSTDVLSYLAQGYVGIARGVGNAYSELTRGVLGTNLGDQLVALGWRPPPIPSPYGPLWTDIEQVLMGATTRVPVAILAFKVIATAASLGSIALIWRILGHVRPSLQLLGTVLFAWNPMIVVELSGEGHNDGLMVFFALAGVLATVRHRPEATLVATTLGIVTKYVPALIAPPQLVYLWRTRTDSRSVVRLFALGAGASLVLAAIVFAPVWVGLQTFEGVRISGEPGPWPTISGALFRFMQRTRPDMDAGVVVRVVVQGLFVAFLVLQSIRVRTAGGTLEACAKISVAYLLLGSPIYFPWYAVFPVALLALSPRFSTIAMIFVVSLMSRLIAPLVDLRPEYNPIPIAAFQVTNAGILLGLLLFTLLLMWGFLGWASHDDAGARPEGVGELAWFLQRVDHRVGLPALARRWQARPEPTVVAEAPPLDLLTPEEIAARTAPPSTRDQPRAARDEAGPPAPPTAEVPPNTGWNRLRRKG